MSKSPPPTGKLLEAADLFTFSHDITFSAVAVADFFRFLFLPTGCAFLATFKYYDGVSLSD
jgi:hypothetical protein